MKLLKCGQAVCAVVLGMAFLAPVVAAQESGVLELFAGMHRIEAEVAATPETRRIGLMNRRDMPSQRGMLFVFSHPAEQCMWMRSTYIPLSVAFLDEKGVIINIENMEPQTENSHCSKRPTRYALEMNQGWFKRRGLTAGSAISGLEKAPAPR